MDGKIILNLSGRKKSNFFMKLLAFLLPFATVFGSVLCSWRYAALPVEAKSVSFGIRLNEFQYHPPVVDDVIGAILTGDKGLNNPAAFNAINIMLNGGRLLGKGGVAASVEPVFDYGNTLRQQLGLTDKKVEFALVDEGNGSSVKYLYTTAVNMGEENSPNVPIGQPIFPVYRAKLVKDGDQWVQEGASEEGQAPSKFFVSGAPGLFGGGPTETPFFDWSQWKKTKKKIQNDQGENPTGRSCYFAALEDISPDNNNNVSPVYMVRQNKNDDNEWVNESAPVEGWAPYVAENGFDYTSWNEGDPPA